MTFLHARTRLVIAVLAVAGAASWSCEDGQADLLVPTGVSATSEADETIVQWEERPGATGYAVHWDDEPDVTKDDEMRATQTPPLVLTGLERGREHFFRVSASYPEGTSDLSDETSAVHTAGRVAQGSAPVLAGGRTELQGGLHVDDSGIYIAWSDHNAREIRFAHSEDLGVTWRWFTIASHDTPADSDSSMSAVVFRLGERIVVPHANYKQPRVATSIDGGETWDVQPLPGFAFPMDSKIVGGQAYVLRSTTNAEGLSVERTADGVAWTSTQVVADRPNTGCLSVTGERIAIAYESVVENTAQLMKFTVSDDGGETWTQSDIDLESDSGYACALAEVEGELFVTYLRFVQGDVQEVWLMLARSSDGGATWEKSVLDEAAVWYGPSSVIVREGQLHVAYHREGELVLQSSDDLGATFVERTLIEYPSSFRVDFHRTIDAGGQGHAAFMPSGLWYQRFDW